MPQTIDPERLRHVRVMGGLTQAALASKAGLNKQAIYRLEKGRNQVRPANLKKLAEALEVDPEVLTGEKPIPAKISQPSAGGDEASYQLNRRIPPAVRNAFELAARRYGVSVSTILRLAPLLFTIVAEASLKHRSKKVQECWTKHDEFSDMASQLPYLDIGLYHDNLSEFTAEEESIRRNDVFGRTLWTAAPSNWDRSNPFATYLEALTDSNNDITISAVGPTLTDYRVCRSEAIALAGEELAESLLNGEVPIHSVPSELLKSDAITKRIEWMHEHKISVREVEDDTPMDLPEAPRIDPSLALDLDI